MWQRKRKDAGFSLIEALVAGGLVTILIISLLPAFYSMLNRSQSSTFRIICNSLVRAKLQQYVTGSGAITAATPGVVPTGFEYTKFRYRDIVGQAGYTTACALNPGSTNALAPGFRENTSNTNVVSATSGTEATLPINLKGFQLWVNLRHYNPRNDPPTLECPTDQNYQFGAVGDAIEVTVTGMIRTEPPVAEGGRGGGYKSADEVANPPVADELGPLAAYGGLRDLKWDEADAASDPTLALPNPELTCAVSQIVYPPKMPFRYWIANDGRMRTLPQTTSNGTNQGAVEETFQSHFRSIWSMEPTTGSLASDPIPNIVSFAVSPDNKVVYVLKPGVLLRYKGCLDYNVTVGTTNFNSVPDCRNDPDVVKDFAANSAVVPIQSIAVDFGAMGDDYVPATDSDDIVYMLFSSGPTADTFELMQYDVATDTFGAATNYTLPDIPRINGILLSHTFPRVNEPSLFVMDNTCYFGPAGAPSNTTYCVSIYNSSDAQLTRAVTDLPLQVQSISN